MRYKVAKPAEYLAITGYGIRGIKLATKAWILPGQFCTTFDISSVNYTVDVRATSADELPFLLPAVFTIGPHVEDRESILKYARFAVSQDKLSSSVRELVRGIIEGGTRAVASSMTVEEIFGSTKEFESDILRKVQLELDQYGLRLYDASLRLLVDVGGHEYFLYLGENSRMVAVDQAKVNASKERMKVEVGSKLREGQNVHNVAMDDANTNAYPTERQGESGTAENRKRAEVNTLKNEWEAEVVKASVDAAIEYSHSHRCGQTETPSHNHSWGQTEAPSSSGETHCSSVADNMVVNW